MQKKVKKVNKEELLKKNCPMFGSLCQENKCAWYYQDDQQCSIKTIADTMRISATEKFLDNADENELSYLEELLMNSKQPSASVEIDFDEEDIFDEEEDEDDF